MDNPNSLKPNTLYSLMNNDNLLLYKTDELGTPIDLVNGESGPTHRNYVEIEGRKGIQLLAWQMQQDGKKLTAYGIALEKIVGDVNSQTSDSPRSKQSPVKWIWSRSPDDDPSTVYAYPARPQTPPSQ